MPYLEHIINKEQVLIQCGSRPPSIVHVGLPQNLGTGTIQKLSIAGMGRHTQAYGRGDFIPAISLVLARSYTPPTDRSLTTSLDAALEASARTITYGVWNAIWQL